MMTAGNAKPQLGTVNHPIVESEKAELGLGAPMDTEITALEEKLAKTRAIKQGMMHTLLTGRIRLL